MPDDNANILDPKRGTNQSGLRDLNARLVLSYLRRHGALPSAEIARRSGLSAQTVSNIVRALEGDGLLRREAAVKGKVGKPSVPMALDPNGVFSLGLNIGRRSAELVLVDFHGNRIDTDVVAYELPTIEGVFAFLTQGVDALLKRHPNAVGRIAGLGVARPGRIWEWLEVAHAAPGAMDNWRDLDLSAAVREATGFEAFIENDATSACVAEHMLGRGREFRDFVYVFVGTFVGGGLVLDEKVLSGKTLNAAALGPLPVPDGNGGARQLLEVASLYTLEAALRENGIETDVLWNDKNDWDELDHLVAPWVAETGRNLAIAALAIASVVEVEAVLIDGALPPNVRTRLVNRIQAELTQLDVTGLEDLRVEAAEVGRHARSIGAALLPIHALYFLA